MTTSSGTSVRVSASLNSPAVACIVTNRIVPAVGFRPGLHPGAGRLVARAARHRSPPGHSRWLAAHIPHATAHFPADQNHANIEENNRSAAIAWVRSHI